MVEPAPAVETRGVSPPFPPSRDVTDRRACLAQALRWAWGYGSRWNWMLVLSSWRSRTLTYPRTFA